MSFNINRNTAILLVLVIAGLLIIGYIMTQGHNDQTQNQTQNGNITTGQNQTQNVTAGQPNQTQNGTPGQNQTPNGNVTVNQTQNVTIANPAAVYCVQHGGISKIITAADGSQSGICVLSDGTQCEEWAYYRGECPTENHGTGHSYSTCTDSNCKACKSQTACAAHSTCLWNSTNNTCMQKCSNSSCWACANETECGAYGLCLWNSTMNACIQKCSGSSCWACISQTECNVWPSCQWDLETQFCNVKPPACSNTSCWLCANQTECELYSSCLWNSTSSMCNAKPPNIPILEESDFKVVDYSIPNLLASVELPEMPTPPEQ